MAPAEVVDDVDSKKISPFKICCKAALTRATVEAGLQDDDELMEQKLINEGKVPGLRLPRRRMLLILGQSTRRGRKTAHFFMT